MTQVERAVSEAFAQLQQENASWTQKVMPGAKLEVGLPFLRAAGIPAGYSLVHVTKDAFAGPHTLPELLELISPITLLLEPFK